MTKIVRKNIKLRCVRLLALAVMLVVVPTSHAAGSRIWGTGGITNVSGAGGGGITTWALLNGYASDNETTVNISPSRVETDDFALDSVAVGFDWHDRVALTAAENILDVKPLHRNIHQQNVGLKVRLYGQALYDRFGQFSAGARYTHNSDTAIPKLLGARDAGGVDYYLAWSKVLLAAVAGRNVVINATTRATRANQIGLLGFGGDKNNGYSVLGEFSAGLFVTRKWLIGAEYRQKPDNLSAVKENDWKTVYVAFVPSRYLAVTAAYADLGDVAGYSHQNGYFISLQTGF